jgi:tripartite-type tricarboxylate transporter receptor subunit TctC
MKSYRLVSSGRLATLLAGAVASMVSGAAAQDAVADFYRGRTLQLIIPSNVGGSVGLYGRLASDHLGRHIPGNPNVILVTTPGAGGVQSVEFIANVSDVILQSPALCLDMA